MTPPAAAAPRLLRGCSAAAPRLLHTNSANVEKARTQWFSSAAVSVARRPRAAPLPEDEPLQPENAHKSLEGRTLLEGGSLRQRS